MCGSDAWPDQHDCVLAAGADRESVRGEGILGWLRNRVWIGVLVRDPEEHAVWWCQHFHDSPDAATRCARETLAMLQDSRVDPSSLPRPRPIQVTESAGFHAGVPGLASTAWGEILEIFGNRCRYCGAGGRMERDHRVPMSRAGRNRISNIVPACRQCNQAKGTATEVEYLTALRLLWGRRIRPKPRSMDQRLMDIERRHAKAAVEDRSVTLLRALAVPLQQWPLSLRPVRAEIGVHRKKQVKVTGTSFHSEAVQGCLAKQDLWRGYAALVPEPSNPRDSNAVGFHVRSGQIGYLPRSLAATISDDLMGLLRDGVAVAARAAVFRTEKGMGARLWLDTPLTTRPP